ncbi:MAG: histidine--tRNA ligase [Patescibacteria group bacterium]
MAKYSDAYKGVRDFYPEDERIQRYIFSVMQKTVESFGYEPYNASILEPTELYTTKTSEEIIKEQTYTFKDRGDRSVTLRPEMTPTVARMVAARKRELGYPLRWYSIPNCFRYERPQKGRLREFWQLNVDLFGADDLAADVEITELAYRIMRAYGAKEEHFEIKIADRALLETAFDASNLDKEQREAYRRLLDKKPKMTREDFEREAKTITPNDPLTLIERRDPAVSQARAQVDAVLETLTARGMSNVSFDPSIVRGFNYYSGVVFELFDVSGEDTGSQFGGGRRSLFGGGRYDYLVEEYGGEHVPAVGFGMGDVTIRDFLGKYHLLPKERATADLYLAPVSSTYIEQANGVAQFLRDKGIRVALGLKHEKIGDHIKTAIKLGIPCFMAYGENETRAGMVTIKNLVGEEERTIPLEQAPRTIQEMVE